MYFDLLIVIPLEVEFNALIGEFEVADNMTDGDRVQYSLKMPHGLTAFAVLQDEMGYYSAVSTCIDALGQHQYGLAISIGIAGGLSSDIKLGDVCYSSTIIDTVNNGKIRDSLKGGEEVDLASDFLPTKKDLYAPLGFPRVMPELQAQYTAWQDAQQSFALSQIGDASGYEKDYFRPESHGGNIICGLVTESKSYKRKLQQIQRKVLAIDTESGALFRACRDRGLDALTIRGISDLADSSKKKLEVRTQGAMRKIAAQNAVSFLRLQLNNEYFVQAIFKRRPSSQGILPLQDKQPSTSILAEILKTSIELIEENLRTHSYAYGPMSDGLQLPLPRLLDKTPAVSGSASVRTPLEVRQVLEYNSRIVVSIPRTFPDKGLSWLIAYNLIGEIIDGHQLVPIVISGERIKPPRGTLKRLSSFNIEDIQGSGAKVVFVIDGFDIWSRTSNRFLEEQVRLFPDAKVIVLCGDSVSIKEMDDFVSSISATQFALSQISFSEMAFFLSRHFELSHVRAEVIALRLRDLFLRFELPAHPTYFAGIPQEMLASLLSANRRAELIQLAVDGFLTFVVADDNNKQRLSRSTRASFLRTLVRKLRIEKRVIKYNDIVNLAVDMFKERGFPNDPEDFLAGFYEKGILSKTEDRVTFGLPFIEAYFLTLELADDIDEAISYFDVDSPDLLAFDLYAEIVAHPKLVSHFLGQLSEFVPENDEWQEDALLMGTDIQPEVLRQRTVVSALQRRLDIALETVKKGQGDTAGKQRLLDLADHIHSEISERREVKVDQEAWFGTEKAQLDRGLSLLALVTVLLGQGSEKLDAELKTRLIMSVISATAKLMNDWTRSISALNFRELKISLTSEEMLGKFSDVEVGTASALTIKEIVGSLVDMMELSILTTPARVMLTHLTEEAGHNVLIPLISSAPQVGLISRIIQGTWLTEIDAQTGKKSLNSVLRDLPSCPFLRTALATHFLMRVYWSLAEKGSRLELLSAADQLVQPLGRKLPLREIKREIEANEIDPKSF